MLSIKLLGQVEVRYESRPVEGLRSARLQALLAYLLIHRDKRVYREELAWTLWPDRSSAQGRNNLRRLIYRLKKEFPQVDQWLEIKTDYIVWHSDRSIEVDLWWLESYLSGDAKLDMLPTLIGMLPLTFMPTHFEEWVLAFGEKLIYRCRRRLFEIAELAEEAQAYAIAIQAYQKLLEEDSTQEAVYRRVMRLQAHLGNRSTALQTYQACLDELRDQLGVLPGEETRKLHLRILQEDPISSPRLAVTPHEVSAKSPRAIRSAKKIGRFQRRPIASHISFHARPRQSASRL